MKKLNEMLLEIKHAIARLRLSPKMVAIQSVLLEVTGLREIEGRGTKVDLHLHYADIDALNEFANKLKQNTKANSYVSNFRLSLLNRLSKLNGFK